MGAPSGDSGFGVMFPPCGLCGVKEGFSVFTCNGRSLSLCLECSRVVSHGYLNNTRDFPPSAAEVFVLIDPTEDRSLRPEPTACVAVFTNESLANGLSSKRGAKSIVVPMRVNDPVHLSEAIVHMKMLCSGPVQ